MGSFSSTEVAVKIGDVQEVADCRNKTQLGVGGKYLLCKCMHISATRTAAEVSPFKKFHFILLAALILLKESRKRFPVFFRQPNFATKHISQHMALGHYLPLTSPVKTS